MIFVYLAEQTDDRLFNPSVETPPAVAAEGEIANDDKENREEEETLPAVRSKMLLL